LPPSRAPLATLLPYTTLFRSLVHVAHQHILGAKCLPVSIDELRGPGWQADHVFPRDGLEDPGVAQVTADDASQVLGKHRRTLPRSEEHTSELQSRENLVCRLL